MRGMRVFMAAAALVAGSGSTLIAAEVGRVVAQPPAGMNRHYVCNQAPLEPSRLVKLPIGEIVPQGWLRQMLVLEAGGMTGHLEEISPWCKFEGNAWSDPTGAGHSGWEELPYWLKGYGDLGYVLGDERIIQGARKWIEAVLASGEDDGWFGPRGLKTSLDGKADLWPHMVMLNALQSYHEYTGDPRVLELMKRYCRWELELPDDQFLAGYWPNIRAGDNIESALWLYNRTGEAWLLELADKIQRRCAPWTTRMADWHGVNISQSFRQPAMTYVRSRNNRHLAAAERNYFEVMGLYGQLPGGGFGADENCREGYYDPRQGFETCGIVELMHSFEMLTKISGEAKWADRCEELAFNTLPAALTADLKGLHYLTAANQPQLDPGNKAPGIQNGGNMFAYSPGERFRCCQHNVSHGWPYYAEELWLATADDGLCASLYAASTVSATVGDGVQARLVETTEYPFGDTVAIRVECPAGTAFPLYLRIPGWCDGASATLNQEAVAARPTAGSYLVLDRAWSTGDEVKLTLPMAVKVRTWARNHGAVSVDRGPLTFSLAIGERWERYGGTDEWPELAAYPTTPWNYGLELDGSDPAASFTVESKPGAPALQPFTLETAPLTLRVKARKVPAWQLDGNGLCCTLQDSPAVTGEPVEEISLVPMGCARLRLSAFPIVGGPGAREWVAPPTPPKVSHCWGSDTPTAVNDGIEPARSSDTGIPRLTWWDHRGTTEWVQYDFPEPREVSSVQVYWFDDTGIGQCRLPASWRLLALQDGQWVEVEAQDAYGVAPDRYNEVRFRPVLTAGLRLEVTLQGGFSGGVLEWRAGGSTQENLTS